jgi:hypothetical protein
VFERVLTTVGVKLCEFLDLEQLSSDIVWPSNLTISNKELTFMNVYPVSHMDVLFDSSLEGSTLLILLSVFKHSLKSLAHTMDKFFEPVFAIDFNFKFFLISCS